MKTLLAFTALLALSAPSFAQEDGSKAWEKIHAVLSHPRCANCHTPDDHPRWSAHHVHRM
jgi:mono/diheme cytochrome c family protein